MLFRSGETCAGMAARQPNKATTEADDIAHSDVAPLAREKSDVAVNYLRSLLFIELCVFLSFSF